ncbi:putative RNA methyltransferase [Alkalihalobacillus pseudalcaliphilus]|uniref:putative RNA methyltransferase n=1 Tax=Alkalihalobacillus pseudalcaliphilus TaxID=79884 RepID=UPI00064DD98A|nr:methyltransferase domain-containing protein [Alkalihalobacillus pseudalcaliphilus]KMK76854.1 SAM-dependent methyltransferase [Alkalihalobacillus pseudalcaliphilus]
MTKSKKIINAELVQKFEHHFRCPLCEKPITVEQLKSFTCQNNHSFDFTKQGYLNLMTQPSKTDYDKKLFEHRQHLIAKTPFFHPLHEELVQIIQSNTIKQSHPLTLLDIGCGEGSHLHTLLQHEKLTNYTGFGLDIAKEGIIAAAKAYTHKIWLVGDLAKSPFQSKSFDLLLNILSPSNYEEFKRILKNEGTLIKVIPASNYLSELRTFFYENQQKETYQNDDTLSLFQEHFPQFEEKRVTYQVKLDRDELTALVYMTPLTWRANAQQKQDFINTHADKLITIDLLVLIGSLTQ